MKFNLDYCYKKCVFYEITFYSSARDVTACARNEELFSFILYCLFATKAREIAVAIDH